MGMTGRQRRRCKQLLDDLEKTRRYWKMKEEVLDCTVWRTHFGKKLWICHKTDSRMNEGMNEYTHACQYCLRVAIRNGQNMLEFSPLCG
jgi:hypothetical protein